MTDSLPVPDWFNPKKILAEYVEGKSTEKIAQSLGVTKPKLVHYLTTRAPEDWKEAVLIRALKRQEEAEEEIDGAGDHLALRKAEAKLKSAQWNMERVCRKIYGDVKEQPAQQAVQLIINLRRGAEPPETSVYDQPTADAEPAEPLPASLPAPAQEAQPEPKKKKGVVISTVIEPAKTNLLDYSNGPQFV